MNNLTGAILTEFGMLNSLIWLNLGKFCSKSLKMIVFEHLILSENSNTNLISFFWMHYRFIKVIIIS